MLLGVLGLQQLHSHLSLIFALSKQNNNAYNPFNGKVEERDCKKKEDFQVGDEVTNECTCCTETLRLDCRSASMKLGTGKRSTSTDEDTSISLAPDEMTTLNLNSRALKPLDQDSGKGPKRSRRLQNMKRVLQDGDKANAEG